MASAYQHAAVARAALAAYDVVLTPTLATLPVEVGTLRHDADPSLDFAAQKAFTPWTSAWNVTGMPAVSLPLHMTGDGLPVGVSTEVARLSCRTSHGRGAYG